MQLRGYQTRIVNEIGQQNAIILLPTGSGKTLIASEILKRFKPDQKFKLLAIFFVPKRVLVAQQAQAIKEWTQLNVAAYHGGLTLPQQFDILVSTPQSFLSIQGRLGKLRWSCIGMVIFDEVHHVLKDHPYRKIAYQIPEQTQIIGLTASLTYGVTEKQVNKTMQRLAYELRVKVLATATAHELQQDGYHGNVSKTDKRTLELQISGTIPLKERKPHLMCDMFWNRYKKHQLTPHAKCIVNIIHLLEKKAKSYMIGFKSPLIQKKLSLWGTYAHRQKLYFLEHWYESLRIMMMNWEDADGLELAVAYLKMMDIHALKAVNMRLDDCIINEINRFFSKYGDFCPKLNHLKNVLLEKHSSQSKLEGIRAIIFVQQKVSVHIVSHFILTDDALKSKAFKAVSLYSTTTKPPTPTLSLSKKQAEFALDQFAKGNANILVCTTVAEEGIDVAAANCVIRFNSVLNSVSFVQGRGRARQRDSSFVIMSEEKERTIDRLESIEKLQSNIADKFHQLNIDSEDFIKKQRDAQQSRERNAKTKVLSKWGNTNNKSLSLSVINRFCKSTKVVLIEKYLKEKNKYICTLEYKSCLRTVRSTGYGNSKKESKRNSASNILDILCQQI